MKRNTTALRNFVVCIIGIVAMMMLSMPVAAATPKSVSDPVKARNSKTINQLIKAGDYYGWTSEAKTLKESAGSIKTRVEMRNSKWYYTVDVTVKIKNRRIMVDYQIKNKSYPLTSIKKMLKQYAVPADKRTVLEDAAAIAANKLVTYGQKMGWTTSTKDGYKNKTAVQTITFTNNQYKFTAVVKSYRKNGKIMTAYVRQGSASTAKAIKSWLKNYKV